MILLNAYTFHDRMSGDEYDLVRQSAGSLAEFDLSAPENRSQPHEVIVWGRMVHVIFIRAEYTARLLPLTGRRVVAHTLEPSASSRTHDTRCPKLERNVVIGAVLYRMGTLCGSCTTNGSRGHLDLTFHGCLCGVAIARGHTPTSNFRVPTHQDRGWDWLRNPENISNITPRAATCLG